MSYKFSVLPSNIKPQKKLGQNFLWNPIKSKEIVDSWELKNDNILEVGPGMGALTDFFLDNKKIILVEKDQRLSKFLVEKYIDKKIEIFNLDLLEFDFKKNLKGYKWKAISNLPFNSAKKILREFIEHKEFFTDFYFSFPFEFAKKILNKKKSSFWSLLIQSNAIVEENFIFKKKDFLPVPKIDVLFLHFKVNNKKNIFSDSAFSEFIKNCFFNKRKKFINNKFLINIPKEKIIELFLKHDLDVNARSEDASLLFFIELFNLKKFF